MTFLAGLEEFVHSRRSHGPLTADATEPAWNGYLLTVAFLSLSSENVPLTVQ